MMSPESIPCPQCDGTEENENLLDRRAFLGLVGGAAALAAAGYASPLRAADVAAPAAPVAGPAEALVKELYAGMNEAQRTALVLPWDHREKEGAQLTRHRMYNRFISQRIGNVLTKNQNELVQKIARAICSDEEGFGRIETVVKRDTGGGWNGIGANIFGNPEEGPFAWVLSAHHLTLRCDGDSEPDTAFGGPMYYGHSVEGSSRNNVFNFQTQSVARLFDALSEKQRAQAVINGTPGELYPSIQLRGEEKIPGLVAADLTADQHTLVQSVMRDLLAPFRHEDAEEAMAIVRKTGGLDHLRLSFYKDRRKEDPHAWIFWRIEGPGFVWNYRVLPHVHCYVNIGVNKTA